MASLAGLLQQSALAYGDHIALVDPDGATTSYSQLWHDARCAATALAARISPGDRVLVQLPNSREFVIAYYAILIAGGVVVPLPGAATEIERAAVLRDSGATVAIVAGAVELASNATEPVARNDDEPAAILYTSGTSGDPKGVVLTHGNLLSNATVASRDIAGFTSEDVMLVTVQFAHAFGMTSVLNACLYAGATLVIPRRWDPVDALALMDRHGVTVVRGVPTTYVDLLAVLDGRPGPPLRAAFSGGAPMPVALLAAVEKAFHTTVWEGYGLTEASPLVACNQRQHGRRAGTVGHEVPGVEVRIRDADATTGVGEVVVRGPNVMQGYWNRPEDTAAVLAGGWLHTGDMGVVDGDGFLRIVDRAKDVIKRGGAAVYPREVEERLVMHEAVREAAVVGVPDVRYGERVVAAVVLDSVVLVTPDVHGDGVTPDVVEGVREELTSWCRAALSAYKCPVDIRLVKALPRGPTGKVLKRAVCAWWSTSDPTTTGRRAPS